VGGCKIPYAYPKLEHTPSVKLDSAPGEVHAFRVDRSRSIVDAGATVSESLREVPIRDANEIQAETKPSATYGIAVVGFALNYLIQRDHTVEVRLHRPGFESVVIRPWEHVDQVQWKPAVDFAAQEQALDGLLSLGRDSERERARQLTSVSYRDDVEPLKSDAQARPIWRAGSPETGDPVNVGEEVRHSQPNSHAESDSFFALARESVHLCPGSKSSAHRAALVFGATEYDRLSNAASTDRQKNRLKNKANELRKLAVN
jgi:hypothetical protein